MDKLKMHSHDLGDANIERIADLFPACVRESRDDKATSSAPSSSNGARFTYKCLKVLQTNAPHWAWLRVRPCCGTTCACGVFKRS